MRMTSTAKTPKDPRENEIVHDAEDDAPGGRRVSLSSAVAGFLFLVAVGLVVLLLVSVAVVWVASLAATKLGLSGIYVIVMFLGLLAAVVVGLVGTRIAADIAEGSENIASAIDSASDANSNGVNGLPTVPYDDLPTVSVQPRASVGTFVTEAATGALFGRGRARKSRE